MKLGDVGMAGVAIDSIEDMKVLFDQVRQHQFVIADLTFDFRFL